MSDKEQTGKRDLTYSRWHRIESTRRFLPAGEAWELGMIDIDDVEYCRRCSQPLALIETTKDVGQREKVVAVTKVIARKLEVPAYVVFVTATPDGEDVKSFRVRKVAPALGKDIVMAPQEFAGMLAGLRVEHKPHCTAVQASLLITEKMP